MKQGLIQGPWSKQEDEILKEYVKTYGSKKWNRVQKLTGLPRDGKSCRLRWLNHLNPYLKKGKFSEEEKQQILQLRQLGGEWCKIAKQLPGRTDNEIKNFFNINERKKRKMENDNGECRKKKKNNLPLKDHEIMKPHYDELNGNGVMSGSGNQQQDISSTHEMEFIKDICNCSINHPSDSFHIPIIQPLNMVCNNAASTSISNNSSPTFIDRGEALMPIGMISYLPPLLEIESPLHSDTWIIKNSSPTFIDRGETSNMEPNLSPLPESINFQSFESPLIHKYPPLPLQPPEEIRLQQLEPDLPPLENINFQSLESGLLIHKYPPLPLRSAEEIQQEQLEPNSNGEDLIDLLDSLGWLDGYIF